MNRDVPLRDLVQDAHLSLLLGAGTASPYFSLLGNIEETLTELERAEAPAAGKAVAKASVEAVFFDEVIAPNRALLEGHAGQPKAGRTLLKDCRSLIQTLHNLLQGRQNSLLNKQLSIFTPNVDMSLDLAFEDLGIQYSDGFAGKIQPRFDFSNFGLLNLRHSPFLDHVFEVPTFNLHRLHGSVGWRILEEDSGPSFEFDRNLEQAASVQEALEACRSELCSIENPASLNSAELLEEAKTKTLTDGIRAFTNQYKQIGIVNPTKAKFGITVLNDFYYEQIRLFANTLEKPNSVLLAHGFSFRDEHLRRLVLRAARTNPTLRVIVFCYSNDALEDYERLMPPGYWPNSNIDYVCEAPTGEGDGTAFLTLERFVENFLQPILIGRNSPDPSETESHGNVET